MSKKRILFLDDRSKRIMSAIDRWHKDHDLTIVCTAKEAIKMLSLQDWDIISLDYDLNFQEFTPAYLPGNGMEVVQYICSHSDYFHSERRLPLIVIHSGNPAEAHNMVTRLKESGFTADYRRWEYE